MPCLTDVIDCLICGERTSCSQVAGSNPDDPKKHWTVYFCKLFAIEDEALQEQFRQSYFCLQCACKINSIEKIGALIENMQAKLEEIRVKTEDDLYLCNTHLLITANGDSEEKTQNGVREKMVKSLEDIKKKKTIPTFADAEILTDPVIIVEHDEPEPAQVIVLPDGAAKEDKECQCSLSQDSLSAVSSGRGAQAGGGNKQMIKMLIKSEHVSQEIIKALTAPTDSTGVRHLIIRGYRGVEQGEQGEEAVLDGVDVAASAPAEPKRRAGRPAGAKSKYRRIPPHVCKICREDYQTPQATRAHTESTHKQGNLWMCPHCSTTLTTEKSLIRHVGKHYYEEAEKAEQQQQQNGEAESAIAIQEIQNEMEVDPQPVAPKRPKRNSRKRKESTSEEEEIELSEDEEEEVEEVADEEEEEEDGNFEVSDESSDESVEEEQTRRSSRRRVSTPRAAAAQSQRKRGRPPKQAKTQMVIKVPSNKRVSSSVVSENLEEPLGPSPLGTRLRSKFRTYFN